MLLSGILDLKLIYPMVKGSSKNGIIEMLLDEMSARYRFQQPKHEIFMAITALEMPVVKDVVEIRLVALILTSLASGNLYLNFLAPLFKLSEKAGVFSGIHKARTLE